jgi:hypothetical protein
MAMAEEPNTDRKEFGPHTVEEVDKIDQLLVTTKRLLPLISFSKRIWLRS